jgi:regulator of ribonuclease activity B
VSSNHPLQTDDHPSSLRSGGCSPLNARSLGRDGDGAYPNDENGAVLRDMAAQGSDLVSPRMMDFEDPEEDRGWEVQCRHRMVPTHAAITQTERRLADVAERFGGYADGWGSLSNPDGSPA